MSYNTVIKYMFFKNKVKNGKHVYNIENLNIKTNLDCMAFTSLLSISSSFFTYGTPQDVITTSWSKHWLYEGESNSQVHLRPHIPWNTPFNCCFQLTQQVYSLVFPNIELSFLIYQKHQVIASHCEHYLYYYFMHLQSEP